jgi:hypothetical protein
LISSIIERCMKTWNPSSCNPQLPSTFLTKQPVIFIFIILQIQNSDSFSNIHFTYNLSKITQLSTIRRLFLIISLNVDQFFSQCQTFFQSPNGYLNSHFSSAMTDIHPFNCQINEFIPCCLSSANPFREVLQETGNCNFHSLTFIQSFLEQFLIETHNRFQNATQHPGKYENIISVSWNFHLTQDVQPEWSAVWTFADNKTVKHSKLRVDNDGMFIDSWPISEDIWSP